MLLNGLLILALAGCSNKAAAPTDVPETGVPIETAVPQSTARPQCVETAPDGTAFAQGVELAEYDNPNFSVQVLDGVATVEIIHAELWTDFADPESEIEAERQEGQRRLQISQAIAHPRTIDLPAAVTAVYELPCSTWFPGSDANAVIGTEDGAWYYVDLTGADNDGVPQCTELAAISGQENVQFSFRTTSFADEGGVQHVGEDYVIAVLQDGGEQIVWPEK